MDPSVPRTGPVAAIPQRHPVGVGPMTSRSSVPPWPSSPTFANAPYDGWARSDIWLMTRPATGDRSADAYPDADPHECPCMRRICGGPPCRPGPYRDACPKDSTRDGRGLTGRVPFAACRSAGAVSTVPFVRHIRRVGDAGERARGQGLGVAGHRDTLDAREADRVVPPRCAWTRCPGRRSPGGDPERRPARGARAGSPATPERSTPLMVLPMSDTSSMTAPSAPTAARTHEV